MVQMIAGWIAGLVLGLLTAATSLLAHIMQSAGQYSLALAQQPWVSQMLAVTTAVAASIFALAIAYQALTDWILWNEGTSTNQPGFFKAAFRVGVYGGLGAPLAYATFRWGFGLAAALMASPVSASFSRLNAMALGLQAMPNANIATSASLAAFTLLLLCVGSLILVISVTVVIFEMFVRGAELTLFVLAAPIVALGWLNPGGGMWVGWWQKLLSLSMATAVQWLCLKGMLAMTATTFVGSTGGFLLAEFVMAAWVVVAFKGPHLVAGWLSYSTGSSKTLGQQGGQIVGQHINRVLGP